MVLNMRIGVSYDLEHIVEKMWLYKGQDVSYACRLAANAEGGVWRIETTSLWRRGLQGAPSTMFVSESLVLLVCDYREKHTLVFRNQMRY